MCSQQLRINIVFYMEYNMLSLQNNLYLYVLTSNKDNKRAAFRNLTSHIFHFCFVSFKKMVFPFFCEPPLPFFQVASEQMQQPCLLVGAGHTGPLSEVTTGDCSTECRPDNCRERRVELHLCPWYNTNTSYLSHITQYSDLAFKYLGLSL